MGFDNFVIVIFQMQVQYLIDAKPQSFICVIATSKLGTVWRKVIKNGWS